MCWQIFQKIKNFKKCTDKFSKKLKFSKNLFTDLSKNWMIWKIDKFLKNENFEKYIDKFS